MKANTEFTPVPKVRSKIERMLQQRDIKNAVLVLPEADQDKLLSSSTLLFSDPMLAFLDRYVSDRLREKTS